MFRPRSIAVLGASTDDPLRAGTGAMGLAYTRALKAFQFPAIYPINPKATAEIAGLPAYASILDVPGQVDQVISCIPASALPKAIEECATKGVKVIQCFTAGYSETGDRDRAAMERELLALLRQKGIRLIGPNGMGIFCPRAGMSWSDSLKREPGSVGLFSQSGGMSSAFVDLAETRGLRISKAVSYGNALDINESDLLDYFLHDSETRVVGGYVEGIKDGRRFQRLLEGADKPVVILKIKTEAGARAVASHTASLAGQRAVWDALCQQRGVIQVASFDEMADVFVALLSFPRLPKGPRVGITGVGGGANVLATEACQRAGLEVPALPEAIQKELLAFSPDVGGSVRNPVDNNNVLRRKEDLARTVQLMAQCPQIDFLLIHMGTNFPLRPGWPDPVEAVLEASRQVDKPIAVAILRAFHPDRVARAFDTQDRLQKAGIPVFYSPESAASAISKVVWYYEVKNSRQETS